MDINNPKQFSIQVILVSFIIFVILLYLAKPIWILQVNKKTSDESIYFPLLFLYSFLFANIAGIIAFILTNKKKPLVLKEGSFYYAN